MKVECCWRGVGVIKKLFFIKFERNGERLFLGGGGEYLMDGWMDGGLP